MALTINTNVPSLNTQRQLNASQASLTTSLQRLSSGLRINSAKDDAAGLAISERFTTQVRGMDQARRNANDGVSLAQTAEGSMEQMGNLMQRIRELAVQAANATNTASDRQALNQEATQLNQELSRFASTTEFNGQKLFDGTFGSAVYQVGANANQTITATTTNFLTSQYGTYEIGKQNTRSVGLYNAGTTLATLQTGEVVSTAGTATINGATGSGSITLAVTDSARDVATKINTVSQTGVKAAAFTETTLTLSASGSYALDVYGSNTTAANVAFSISSPTGAEGLSQAVSAFNNAASTTGISAKLDGATGIVLTQAEGYNIALVATGANTTAGDMTAGGITMTKAYVDAVPYGGNLVVGGQVNLDSDKSYSVVSTGAALTSGVFGAALAANGRVASSLQSVSTIDITTTAGATQALRIADMALTAINSQRSGFGALQNRFEATINNLQTTSENMSSARSRIRDADFAAETANLTRSQILQQAGTAMLAQANSLPNSVLSLLR
ncbi:flagellin [Sulfurimicrobium lacus]|uniref:Flagellin n=1 Tax=Sulfurimicrobium lacus TaxID=2715678 RepID=A0A6F8VB40_9PROT|nr:flagellin [Sulfurimicrobium lacus]BCB26928.1 flagellin [Sulfurimicrobium lacus]